MKTFNAKNVTWQLSTVSHQARNQKNGHQPIVLWFTGLSGAGKSTIANALEKRLFDLNCQVYVLDGDNIRQGLCADLGFTEQDRTENLRRVAEVAKLFVDAGFIVISAFISPFASDRAAVKNRFNQDNFIEVYCNADITTCENRDVKGLYAKARQGLIKHFTGISSPYEPPASADIVLDTANTSVDACVEKLIKILKDRQILKE